MVGQTILHYQILEKLGAGGTGEIYKAQDTRLNRLVAIKVLSGNAAGDPDFRRRFIHEAQAASSLNHPNIITIYDIVPHGEDHFIVMEYVRGKTLGELIPRAGLSLPLTLQYAVQIADGLDAAHNAGIIHRDLKPGNIMVTDEGRVKILDFGLAKLTGVIGKVSPDDLTQTVAPRTIQGSILGTVNYMSPEQAQGAPTDARSDIFSFGCVLFEMTTGRRTFSADSTLLTLASILRDEPRPIPEISPNTSPELVAVIRRALRKDPAERYQSMRDMLAALTTLRQNSDSGILYLTPPPPERPTRRIDPAPQPKPGHTLPILLIVALLALASAAAWWWTSRRGLTTSMRNNPVSSSSHSPNLLNNQAILDMVANKVPESAIIAQIRSSPTDFNLSTSEIIRLSKGGVSETILRQMRNPAAEPAPVPPPAPQTRTVELAGGIPFEVELSEDVPADSRPGQTLHFAAVTDVTVGSTVVIAKGTPVTGVVMSGAHKRFLAHAARPTFRLLEATAVNGSKIKVRASEGRLGEQRKDKSLDPIAGPKSKNGTVTAGSRFYAYFDGDQTLTLPDSRASAQ